MELQPQQDEEARAFVQKEAKDSGTSLPVAQRFGRRGLAVALGLAIAGAAALALVLHPAASTSGPASESLARSSSVVNFYATETATDATNTTPSSTPEPAPSDPCENLPFLHLEEVMQNNLGNRGPDFGKDEGLWFSGKDSVTHKKIILKVNALSRYYPNSAKQNGFNGQYGTINCRGGKSVGLSFKVFDENMQALTLPEVEFTFFDLDTGSGGATTEFVEVEPYKESFLMSNSELKEVILEPGHARFTASTEGDGSDNPTDPLLLTEQQKNRAVTVKFKNFNEAKVKFGSSRGRNPRYFTFVARPSLLCAKTAGAVDESNEIVKHDETGKTDEEKAEELAQAHADSLCCLVPPLKFYCVETPPPIMFWCR